VKLSPEALAKRLDESEYFDFVEENSVVSIEEPMQECVIQNDAIDSLRRISYRAIPEVSLPYMYKGNGEGVTSYIIDTGISLIHEEFLNPDVAPPTVRASWGFNGIDSDNRDCHGHGTHVAGTVGGIRHGVAKRVTLVAVKVLNCQGSGTVASVVAGVDWVTNNHRKPANANMSLGGGNSAAINASVSASIEAGVSYASRQETLMLMLAIILLQTPRLPSVLELALSQLKAIPLRTLIFVRPFPIMALVFTLLLLE